MSRPRRGKGTFWTIALAVTGVAVLVAAIILVPRPPAPELTTATPAPATSTGTRQPSGPLLALVIDDVGNDEALARRLLSLPVPLTVAVLPFLPYSLDLGGTPPDKEILLHLPMEPEGYPEVDPGRGALLTAMDKATILTTLAADLAGVPGAVGVNNHMGSRFTADQAAMRTVLGDLGSRGLFFLDSRTTASTVGREIAAQTGTPFVSRDVFLDGDDDPASLRGNWSKAVTLAGSRGHAVIIGHLRPATVAFVEERVRAADWGKATPVTLSTIIKRLAGAGPRA